MPIMNDPFGTIAELCESPSLIAITGGGGKTTLMCGVAETLSQRGRVVATTTTKICAPENFTLLDAYEKNALADAAQDKKPLTVGRFIEGDKLVGFAPEDIDRMYTDGVADFFVVEADGAKHLPFKSYSEREPVVPNRATLQVVVVGAEIFSEPVSDDIFFRLGLARERWEITEGEFLPRKTLVSMLECPGEYLKNAATGAKRVLLINKCDLLPSGEVEKIRGTLLSRLSAYDFLMFASLERCEVYSFGPLMRTRLRPR